ncbi:MAG: hypothetical protein ACHQQQ_05945 [Bacteroidota bacterium]
MRKSIVVLGLAILLAIPVFSFAGNVMNQTFPISGTVTDLCTGELVNYTGEAHIVINSSTNPDGTVRLVAHESIRITGVGQTSGASYVGNQTEQERVIQSTGCPFSLTDAIFFRLIGKGPVPNEQIRVGVTLTVDASCTPTFNSTFTAVCP